MEPQRPGERDRLIPPDRPAISAEAGAGQGLCELADTVAGIDRFGISAAGHEALGITAEAVVAAVLKSLVR